MKWDDLRYFLAVAREGQMLGAASRLGVSQPRLSRHVAALEEAVGARLFERTKRSSTLTDDGAALFATAERIEAEVLAGTALLRGRDEVAGTICIGAPDGFGSAFLAPRLGTFRDAYPDLRIQLVPVPRSFSLSEREADLAILVGRPDKGRFRVKKLVDYSLSLYASQANLARAGTPARIDDLGSHTLIGYVDDLIYTPELNYAPEFLRDWRSDIEVSIAIGQFEAVRSGTGIGICTVSWLPRNPVCCVSSQACRSPGAIGSSGTKTRPWRAAFKLLSNCWTASFRRSEDYSAHPKCPVGALLPSFRTAVEMTPRTYR